MPVRPNRMDKLPVLRPGIVVPLRVLRESTGKSMGLYIDVSKSEQESFSLSANTLA